jgi:hypothetical protein
MKRDGCGQKEHVPSTKQSGPHIKEYGLDGKQMARCFAEGRKTGRIAISIHNLAIICGTLFYEVSACGIWPKLSAINLALYASPTQEMEQPTLRGG